MSKLPHTHLPPPTYPYTTHKPVSTQDTGFLFTYLHKDTHMDIKDLVKYLLQDNNPLYTHDATHAHVSTLPRVRMGTYMVSGVHGICIPELWGTYHLVEEYPSLLDEARVGIHQFLSNPLSTPCAVVRYAYWCTYLQSQGINPLTVTYRHWVSMKGGV